MPSPDLDTWILAQQLVVQERRAARAKKLLEEVPDPATEEGQDPTLNDVWQNRRDQMRSAEAAVERVKRKLPRLPS